MATVGLSTRTHRDRRPSAQLHRALTGSLTLRIAAKICGNAGNVSRGTFGSCLCVSRGVEPAPAVGIEPAVAHLVV